MVSRVPSLNWLRVYEAAARSESFARAAAQLNMSPAAVSQQVRALEQHLGRALFTRGPHSVQLTEAGRAYLPPVQQALGMVDGATEALFGQVRAQVIYVQAVLIFAHDILARALAAFEAAHPEIRVMLTTGNSVADFDRGYQDFKIIFGNPHAYGPVSDRLMGEELAAMARPDIAARITQPADLTAHTLIEVATHRSGWDQYLQALRVPPGPRQSRVVDNSLVAASLAQQGLGIALARSPASNSATEAAGLTCCLTHDPIAGAEAYHLIHEGPETLRPPARLFRDFLRRWLGDQGYH